MLQLDFIYHNKFYSCYKLTKPRTPYWKIQWSLFNCHNIQPSTNMIELVNPPFLEHFLLLVSMTTLCSSPLISPAASSHHPFVYFSSSHNLHFDMYYESYTQHPKQICDLHHKSSFDIPHFSKWHHQLFTQ